MDEKYPIKFSIGQFIILLAVQVCILSLVFLLGARLGGEVFPMFYAHQFSQKSPYQELATGRTAVPEGAPRRMEPLEEAVEEEIVEEDPAAEAPHYQVGADGEVEALEEDNADAPLVEEPAVALHKNPLENPADKNTMIRFKSSGNAKFAVEVGEYFDEILASQKIGQLKDKGYEAYLVIKNPESESRSFAVRVGVFSDRSLAEEFATQMSNKQGIELRVVQSD
jgi:cell division septation protein DedD